MQPRSAPQTLAEVRTRIAQDAGTWKPAPRRQMRGALDQAAKLLRTPLTELPCEESAVAAIIDAELGWAACGFPSARAFRDWRGRVLRACRETAPSTRVRFTRRADWLPAWRAFFDDLDAAVQAGREAPWVRRSIAHLARYANARGLGPADVDDQVLADLLDRHAAAKRDAEAGGQKARTYARKAIDAARTWNRCVRAQADKPWLRHLPARELSWPDQRERRNPPLAAFPDSFQREVTAYLDGLRTRDTPVVRDGAEGDEIPVDDVPAELESWAAFEAATADEEVALTDVHAPDGDTAGNETKPRRPLAEATIANRRHAILWVAGALVRRGVCRVEDIRRLRDICTYKALGHAVNDHRQRQHHAADAETRRASASVYQLAETVCTIARDCGAPDGYVRRMRAGLRDTMKTDSVGAMSVGRRQRLEQFDEPWALLAWFDHPVELITRAERRRKAGKPIRSQDIADVETAIVCRILAILPVRRSNVATLRHRGSRPSLQLRRHSSEKSWIFWQPRETKNHRYLRAEIDRRTERWIRIYLEHYRPRYLARHDIPDSEHLFPGSVGTGHREAARLGRALTARMHEVGLAMTMHLARHLGAKLMVDEDPRLDAEAAHLLGDDVRTVRTFYLENRSQQASAQLRDIVQRRQLAIRREWIDGEA